MTPRTWKDFPLGGPEDRPESSWDDSVRIPDHPPPPWFFFSEDTEEAKRDRERFNLTRSYAYLDWQLIDGAWQLAMLSRRHTGRFYDGMELPRLASASAAGAIALACAAFEAALDSTANSLAVQASEAGHPGRARLFQLTRSLSPRDRLEALMSVLEQPFGWDTEPFQSLALVLSVRKHLLHHEVDLYPSLDGYWPAKKLKDLLSRLKSPYIDKPGLEWHQHVLTPDGAEWAVRSVYQILTILDLLWHDLDPYHPLGKEPDRPDQ